MLNYETILSSYDDKLTLMQWLKKVEAALKDASAVSFKVNKKGDATLTFSIVFEDGSELESGEIVLQQGESVASAAIVNGHLILTLTNGDELDAGVLFSGNVSISGNMAVTGKITGAEIVEDMTGYTFSKNPNAPFTYAYAGVCKNGNKITFVIAGVLNTDTPTNIFNAGSFTLPLAVANKIVPLESGTSQVAYIKTVASLDYINDVELEGVVVKDSVMVLGFRLYPRYVTAGTDYKVRIEMTFLLSDNLAA